MHIFFLDESGTAPRAGSNRDKYFVIGGLIIPDSVWHKVRDALISLKVRRQLRGELKWRYFAPNNNEALNPMKALAPDKRNEIRSEIYKIICDIKAIKCMACVCCIEAAYETPVVLNKDDLYHLTYKPLSECFQYYLQDLSSTVGRMETGIIVSDHRGAKDDERFREAHERLLRANGDFMSSYPNLVESLFFQPSNLSVGIQLADMVAGAVWRRFEKGDDTWFSACESAFCRSDKGQIEGYGILKFPKATWQ